MTTIIFAAHGMSAPGMKDSVEMVIGPQNNFHQVMLSQEEGIEAFRKSLTALVTSIKKETDDDILILTDMPAGSPFNVGAQLALQFRQVSVLSGTNFSMVLTALEMAGESLDNILSQVIETGRSAIDSFKETVIAEEDF
ncbi:PTS system, IIA component [Sodalis praecaptivus]|uniref:PTS system, IIA component n=1 Tax=Sodalis praecaptivus TaxID=1239307 RepID=W0I0Y2_9GAMM|nr:PTS sugar transporter subunit IIA [Sodalis praecaptivus]AHF78130.1 PTS system, IIA component [Sodalis praecaptivus]